MTEEQMNKFADLIAKKVIDQIEKKQEEWDKEFQVDMTQLSMDTTFPVHIEMPPTPRELIEKQLDAVRDKLAKALEKEDFEKCKILDEKIIILNKKLLDL